MQDRGAGMYFTLLLCAVQAIESGSRREERSLVLLRRVLLWVTITIVILGTASAVIEGHRSVSLQRKGLLIYREGERAALQQVCVVVWRGRVFGEACCCVVRRAATLQLLPVPSSLLTQHRCCVDPVLRRCCFDRRSP